MSEYLLLMGGIFVTVLAFVVYMKRLNMLTSKTMGDWYEIKWLTAVVIMLISLHSFLLIDKIAAE